MDGLSFVVGLVTGSLVTLAVPIAMAWLVGWLERKAMQRGYGG